MGDEPRDRRGGDDQRTCQVHLSGSASPRKIPILRTHGNLIRRITDAWTCFDACAARWIDNLRSRGGEDRHVASLFGVATNVLRSELNVEAYSRGDALPLRHRVP